ncbi:Probable DNA-directed RNA polymerase I subunit RPA2, partial [Aduncisulcus paluster]
MAEKKFLPAEDPLQRLIRPHIDSFNFLLGSGLKKAVASIPPTYFSKPGYPDIELSVSDAELTHPCRGNEFSRALLPSECREAGLTYDSPFSIKLNIKIGHNLQNNCRSYWKTEELYSQLKSMAKGKKSSESASILHSFSTDIDLGRLPIMVKSSLCHLHHRSRAGMVAALEDEREAGGYFLLNGNERYVRMLIATRRNHIIAMKRNAFKKRGSSYTDYGVSIRCVTEDETAQTCVLHYLTNGACTVRFLLQKQEYFVPLMLILRACRNISDKQIHTDITGGDFSNTFVCERVEMMLRSSHKFEKFNQYECLAYLGSFFRSFLLGVHDKMTDVECGQILLNTMILPQVSDNNSRYHTLVEMTRKLYALVNDSISPENPDATSLQEVHTSGSVLLQLVKENIEDCLIMIKNGLVRVHQDSSTNVNDEMWWKQHVKRFRVNVGKKVNYFLSTGNLLSRTGLGLMQDKGFSVTADKLNLFRFLAHFRSIHRGAFFQEMKTTTVRKLLPESYGFLCCVHLPDGGQCGLLNHLAHACVLSNSISSRQRKALLRTLFSLGVIVPTDLTQPTVQTEQHLVHIPVIVDGCVVGYVSEDEAVALCERVRRVKAKDPLDKEYYNDPREYAKAKKKEEERKKTSDNSSDKEEEEGSEEEEQIDDDSLYVPPTTEIVCQLKSTNPRLWPGVMLFTTPARFLRPVLNKHTG